MNETLAIIVLGLLCIGQGVERYVYAKDMTTKLNDAIKAVMSRNISEYLAATKPVKHEKEEVVQTDEVDISQLNDKEFDAMIKKS